MYQLFVDFYFRLKVTAVERAGSCLTAQPECLLQQFRFFVFVPLKCHKSNIEQIKGNMFLDSPRYGVRVGKVLTGRTVARHNELENGRVEKNLLFHLPWNSSLTVNEGDLLLASDVSRTGVHWLDESKHFTVEGNWNAFSFKKCFWIS